LVFLDIAMTQQSGICVVSIEQNNTACLLFVDRSSSPNNNFEFTYQENDETHSNPVW